jgi:hypothetical protein
VLTQQISGLLQNNGKKNEKNKAREKVGPKVNTALQLIYLKINV